MKASFWLLLADFGFAMKKQKRMSDFAVAASKKRKRSTTQKKHTTLSANYFANLLDTDPVYLNPSSSWYILAKGWKSTPSSQAFDEEWQLHPEQRHTLRIYGRTVLEKRWSQSWGQSYSYSGATNPGKPVAGRVADLLETANDWAEPIVHERPYNACLQNWYTPDDTIGLHADDEKVNRLEFPILSLSWGGPRRFLFREREDSKNKVELFLEDGDLLIMGGTCQETHRHEVPKRRTTMDPPTENRINWTLRAFQATNNKPPR